MNASKLRLFTMSAALVALAALGAAIPADALVDPPVYFKTNCSPCHTIGGGRLVGPDLKGVNGRAERDWLLRFITDPQRMLASSDPYAKKLLAEAKGIPMVKAAGIDAEIAAQLLDFIAAESGSGGSSMAGAKPLRERTPADIEYGEAIYLGGQKLRGGGPACISCHTVAGRGGLGGGRLGPDLTQVASRLGGANGLNNWLSAPPTPQMQANFLERPFGEDEIIGIVAFLEAAGAEGGAANKTTGLFASLGVAGAILNLLLFGGIWKKRLRGVRAPMVLAGKKSKLKLELPGGRNG